MKAVLLAAGIGCRLDPITKKIPKPMISILGKPILEYIITELSHYGIDDILIITGHLGQQIQDYFGNGEKFNVNISYINQSKQIGTGNATQLASDFIENESFMVYLADTIIPNCFSSLKSFRDDKYDVEIVSSYIGPQQLSQSGNITVCNNEVLEINEKPTKIKSNLAWAGIAIFKSKKIFEILQKTPTSSRNELEITDSMNLMLQNGYAIKNHICPRYFDGGTPQGLLDLMKYLFTVIHFPHNSEHFIEPVFSSNTVRIGKNSKIGPFVSIGENVVIRDNVEIKNSLILNNSIIKSNSNIANSIVFEDSIIPCS